MKRTGEGYIIDQDGHAQPLPERRTWWQMFQRALLTNPLALFVIVFRAMLSSKTNEQR